MGKFIFYHSISHVDPLGKNEQVLSVIWENLRVRISWTDSVAIGLKETVLDRK